MQYNPYDLVPLLLNGQSTYGRPVAFDSDVVDQISMKNAFGKYVKPTQVALTCPDCGQGFMLDIKLSEPPFNPYACSCPICKPAPPPMLDPFTNPITSERITINELDPMLHNISKPIAPVTTVAERTKESKPKSPKSKKQPPQAPPTVVEPPRADDFIEYPDAPNSTKLEPAEGMEGDELDFNDDDLVEP